MNVSNAILCPGFYPIHFFLHVGSICWNFEDLTTVIETLINGILHVGMAVMCDTEGCQLFAPYVKKIWEEWGLFWFN